MMPLWGLSERKKIIHCFLMVLLLWDILGVHSSFFLVRCKPNRVSAGHWRKSWISHPAGPAVRTYCVPGKTKCLLGLDSRWFFTLSMHIVQLLKQAKCWVIFGGNTTKNISKLAGEECNLERKKPKWSIFNLSLLFPSEAAKVSSHVSPFWLGYIQDSSSTLQNKEDHETKRLNRFFSWNHSVIGAKPLSAFKAFFPSSSQCDWYGHKGGVMPEQ